MRCTVRDAGGSVRRALRVWPGRWEMEIVEMDTIDGETFGDAVVTAFPDDTSAPTASHDASCDSFVVENPVFGNRHSGSDSGDVELHNVVFFDAVGPDEHVL